MFKKLFSVLFIAAILSGCSSDETSEVVNPCQNVGTFSVTQNYGNLTIAFQDDTNPLYYDLSLVYPSSGNGPENGSKITLNSTSSTIPINSFGTVLYPGQTYLIYIRKACSNESKSDWSEAKTITINAYCDKPYDLSVDPWSGFRWSNRDDNATYYQVQYGPEGFALGSRPNINVNNTYYEGMGMQANTTYDFYVRAFCTNGSGWGEWAGPYTYLSTANVNLCSTPSNITYTLESSNAINVRWSHNGETRFEYAFLNPGQNINNASINSIGISSTPVFTGLSRFVDYTFYVRAVCADGNHTEWVTRTIRL